MCYSMSMNREMFEQLSRDDFIELTLRFHTEVEALRLKVDQLHMPHTLFPISSLSTDTRAATPAAANTP